jgi:hypothetical protein
MLTLTPNNSRGIFEPFANGFFFGFNKGANDLKLSLLSNTTNYGAANSQPKSGAPQALAAGVVERMTCIGWWSATLICGATLLSRQRMNFGMSSANESWELSKVLPQSRGCRFRGIIA